MKPWFHSLICIAALSSASCFAQKEVLTQVNQLELEGRFAAAAGTLSNAMAEAAPDKSRIPEYRRLAFEADRLQRIKLDFPYSRDELFAELQNSVKHLTRPEFDRWVAEGRFDSRNIDGRQRFMGSSVSNLFFRYPELASRRIPPRNTAPLERRRWETCVAIKNAALQANKPYVLPKRFEVTMNVTAKPGAAPPGEIVRAWLPVPRDYPFQDNFEILSSSPAIKHLDDPQSPCRSAFLEEPARAGAPTRFNIKYAYTAHGVSFDIDPARVKPAPTNAPALAEFTREAPHIVFTPEIRALSQTIAGNEPNPARKAKLFFDWIGQNIKYSYAVEYSTIRNISDYCRQRGYGDCGQEALLFMTLCRLNGIPARWQSGWNTFPGDKTIHDWTEIYLAPYGWVPVDPYMSIFATRYATSLTPEQRRQVRDFYFGGLDQFRIIANSDHNQDLQPPKESVRSDDVDFQRGELEWGNHNIYFNQYSYQLDIKELKPPRDHIE